VKWEINPLTKIYEELLSPKWPRIPVRMLSNSTLKKPICEAFCVPDHRMRAFLRFIMEEFPALLKEIDLEFEGLIPHSESATKKKYPEVYGEIMEKKK